MSFLTLYWKDFREIHFSGNCPRLHGHTVAERACFERRLAAMRARDEAARFGRRHPIYGA